MTHRHPLPVALILAAGATVAGCQAPSPANAGQTGTTPPPRAGAVQSRPGMPTAAAAGHANPAPPADTTAPPPRDATRDSLPEPSTPVADTSPQAAATVTETYFALLQANRAADAARLWRDPTAAAAFGSTFEGLGRPQVEVDAPGDLEGAAGSSYVTVPVRFTPPATAANPRPRHGEVILRRVNDVTGSTTEQRHWHIDRIDVAMTPK